MKIRTLLGLTIIGSAIYAHKQNGGELSVASVQKSLRDLWAGIRGKANDTRGEAELADSRQDKAEGGADIARPRAVAGAVDAGGSRSSQPPALPAPGRSAMNEEHRDSSIFPLPGSPGRNR